MCIAILKTKKGKITDEQLKNCFDNNSDGAGIAYTVNNELIIKKGIFTSTDLIKAVREAENICDSNMLIHCRIGTSGVKTAYNTHPFEVNKNVCLIHNGILDVDVPKGSKENDTQIFIKKYLSQLNAKDLMHNECIHNMVKELIGKSNKFVTLDNKGYYKIINEKAGHWKDNVWYSNKSYEEKKTTFFHYSNWDNYRDYRHDRSYWYDDYYYDETEDDFKLVDKTEEEVFEAIYNLKEDDFMLMQDSPIWWAEEKLLLSLDDYEDAVTKYPEDTFQYLIDVSQEAYNEYMEYYDEIMEVNYANDENISVA